jgi:hypothetical protein
MAPKEPELRYRAWPTRMTGSPIVAGCSWLAATRGAQVCRLTYRFHGEDEVLASGRYPETGLEDPGRRHTSAVAMPASYSSKLRCSSKAALRVSAPFLCERDLKKGSQFSGAY